MRARKRPLRREALLQRKAEAGAAVGGGAGAEGAAKLAQPHRLDDNRRPPGLELRCVPSFSHLDDWRSSGLFEHAETVDQNAAVVRCPAVTRTRICAGQVEGAKADDAGRRVSGIFGRRLRAGGVVGERR